MHRYLRFLLLSLVCFFSLASNGKVDESTFDLQRYCNESLQSLPGPSSSKDIKRVCNEIEVLESCHSHNNIPIFHFDKIVDSKDAKRVLVLSLIHGDETDSGGISRRWMERLLTLHPRSSWRMIPIVNPDGLKLKHRMNANGVDLNRNFPSQDWVQKAEEHWIKDKKRNPRRFPGSEPASEVETKCIVKHIKDFSPDFIVSLHTPYGILDFDGPTVNFPKFRYFPWVSLGTYPGSLGRYMWQDNNVPVLTVELKDKDILRDIDQIDKLQDIAGTVAVRAEKKLSAKNFDQIR